MSERFYSDAELYDRLFPGGQEAVAFYRAEADREAGDVLELAYGTGHKLIPIASDGRACTDLELSPDMLGAAERKAHAQGVEVEWVAGDMREFDLGRTFDFVFIAANSLLHLHETDHLVSCLRSVRRHLAPASAARPRRVRPRASRMLAQAVGYGPGATVVFLDPDLTRSTSMSRRRPTQPRR